MLSAEAVTLFTLSPGSITKALSPLPKLKYSISLPVSLTIPRFTPSGISIIPDIEVY